MDSIFAVIPQKKHTKLLSETERFSVLYHDIFDYPLTLADLIKWKYSENLTFKNIDKTIGYRDNYYFLQGREGLIYKRILNNRISVKKMKIAEKASKVLRFVPNIKMIAVTGSLAMGNSTDASDIDLMIITKVDSLWTTRLLVYVVVHVFGLGTRKPNDLRQRDKLCLNMWLDEGDLIWQKKDRNLYTAHEIAQIIPIVNKDNTYEKFLRCNRWILSFWPNAVDRKYMVYSKSYIGKKIPRYTIYNILYTFFEKLAFKLQYQHMKSKITRETITKTRAIFHPHDWSDEVLSRLNS